MKSNNSVETEEDRVCGGAETEENRVMWRCRN